MDNTEQRQINVIVDREETDVVRTQWDSCCMRLDREATIYFSQLSIALITIGFCIFQLSVSETCERDSLYSGVLTLVVGVYLPQPAMR
jgi:hypothetical protein